MSKNSDSDLEKEYSKGQNLIKSLRKKICLFEEKVVAEKSTIEDEDKTLHEKDVLSNKQSGHKRESPQFESNPRKVW